MKDDWIMEAIKSGRGRGNWGHSGRPGKVGGSAPAGAEIASLERYRGRFKQIKFGVTGSEDHIQADFKLRDGTQVQALVGIRRSGTPGQYWTSRVTPIQGRSKDIWLGGKHQTKGAAIDDAIRHVIGRYGHELED